MSVMLYEKNQGFVVEKLKEGEFDYIDSADEVFEADFFRFVQARSILKEISKSYPTPRKKQEVPIWFYMASSISMKFHGVNSFNQYPFVIRCGGMMTALGPEVGTKALNPSDGKLTIYCRGFNDKAEHDRQTPCDKDFLRKLARDTRATRLLAWYNQDVARVMKKHKAFDPEGIFIGDATYIFVPDNEAYELSALMLFDQHGHPVDPDAVPADKIGQYQWRRCYKLVWLLHTTRQSDYFLVAALRVVPGNRNECPVLYDLVDEFVGAVGEGVIRRLIVDRGFIDGEKIGKCKLDHGIEVLIPLKKSMDIYHDAMGLLPLVEKHFEPCQKLPVDACPAPATSAPKSERIRKREEKRRETINKKKKMQPPPPPEKTIVASEVAKIPEFRSWASCPIPVSVIVNRDTYADGHQNIWMLVDTDPALAACESRKDYFLRAQIEERHRQFKCFSDLQKFTSRVFSLVVYQVVFFFLSYSLLQIFLRSQDSTLNNQVFPLMRRRLLPAASYIIVYNKNYVAFLFPLDFTEIILGLEGQAKHKALIKVRKLQLEFLYSVKMSRAP